MTTLVVCVDCGCKIWPLGSRKRCMACRFAYTPPVTGAQLMAKDEQGRIDRAGRLAAIRAANTAKQRRAQGLSA